MPGTRSLRSLIISTTSNKPAPAGPPSPTFSETTNVSAMDFGGNAPEKIITRAHLKNSINGYEKLISTCTAYRAALMTLSKATAAFADAIGNCAGLKGPTYETSTRMQAASGLHHLMSNHWHLLAETCDREYEKPLRGHLDEYRTVVAERSSTYEKALREKSTLIRQTEARNMNRKARNLQSFRENLAMLQKHVDELDVLKASHYAEIVEHEEKVWTVVQGKVSLVVRSTMDVFDRLTAKASDPVIEPMLQSVPDPFDAYAYGPAPASDQIFSILPPLSIGQPGSFPSASPSPAPSSAASEVDPSELLHSGGNGVAQSPWAHIGAGGYFASGSGSDPSAAWADVASPTSPASPSANANSQSPGSPPTPTLLMSAPRPLSPPRRDSASALASASSTSPGTSSGSGLGHKSKRSTESSKLRHALGSIEEHSDRSDDGNAMSNGNGNGWHAPQYGEDPYSHNRREGSESTVRHSVALGVDNEDGVEPPLERTRSPLSDDTSTERERGITL